MRLDNLIAKLQKIREKEGNIRCISAEAIGSQMDIPYPLRVWIRRVTIWDGEGERVVVLPVSGAPL